MSLNDIKICCPKCKWQPDGGEYWQCYCGHVWDTFTTTARCRACHYQHEYTSCIDFAGGCESSSPHQDWYQGLDKVVEEILEEVKEEVGVAENPQNFANLNNITILHVFNISRSRNKSG